MVSTGIIFALLSMVFWGISDATIKPLAKKFGALNAAVYKFLPHVFFLVIYLIINGFIFPRGFKIWALIISFGIIGAVGLLGFFKAIETGLVSVNVAIAHACVIVTAALSAVFLGEILGAYQYLAIGLIVIGLVLLTFDFASIRAFDYRKFSKGAKYAYITVFSWGIIYVIMKPIINEIGVYAAPFYTDFFVVLFIFLIFLRKKPGLEQIRSEVLKKNNLLFLLGSSLASFFAVVLMVISFSHEKVAVSMGIITAAPLVTTVLAMIFFKERVNRIQIGAIILIILSIAFLSYMGG